ncbi:MAG: AIPR family protein [Candidatus Pacebacteria bacterium]|nr:AIPR family protein [Candidatus Paceibacterota bacterium]
MSQIKIKKLASFRKIFGSPSGKSKNMYVAVLNVQDLPQELEQWLHINPREATASSGVSKKIQASLVEQPEAFVFRNRGLTIITEKVEFDTQENVAILEMHNPKIHGLLDGGHTYRVIRNEIENTVDGRDDLKNAYVRVELLEGFSDLNEVVDIVDARNRSAQVKEQSLEELRSHFETIKEVLKGQSYSDRIAYKEIELLEDGSKKDIDIKDILSYLVCFDAESFSDKKHPISAYSGKSSALRHYADNRELMTKYTVLLPKILQLVDTITREIPESYNFQGGRWGGLQGVITEKESKKKIELPFIGGKSQYQTPSGFIYPILAAFRSLVNVEKNKASWKSDPIDLFEEVKPMLAEAIGEQAIEFRNPTKLGKDSATWRLCYALVALEVAKRGY